MTALARKLQARNHEVVFLYSSSACGLPFVPGPEDDHTKEMVRDLSTLREDDVLNRAFCIVLAQTETILKSLPAGEGEPGGCPHTRRFISRSYENRPQTVLSNAINASI
jgi:hypothetical protein